MAYVVGNPKTKKELKERVRRFNEGVDECPVTVFETGPFGTEQWKHCWGNGEIFVEGPHSPEPHRWYARVLVEDGRIVKVLS